MFDKTLNYLLQPRLVAPLGREAKSIFKKQLPTSAGITVVVGIRSSTLGIDAIGRN